VKNSLPRALLPQTRPSRWGSAPLSWERDCSGRLVRTANSRFGSREAVAHPENCAREVAAVDTSPFTTHGTYAAYELRARIRSRSSQVTAVAGPVPFSWYARPPGRAQFASAYYLTSSCGHIAYACNLTARGASHLVRAYRYILASARARAIDRAVPVVADKGPQLRLEREKWEAAFGHQFDPLPTASSPAALPLRVG